MCILSKMRILYFLAKIVRIYKLFLELVIAACYNIIQRCRALLHIGSKPRIAKSSAERRAFICFTGGITYGSQLQETLETPH